MLRRKIKRLALMKEFEKLSNKDTATFVAPLAGQVQHLPRELHRSLTWDRSKELADHKCLALATDLDIYFCDPNNPWQRGTNENTNRLLRQYFPKGTDFSVPSQGSLDAVARQLNERPRKTLNYFSPAEKFDECIAAVRWIGDRNRTFQRSEPIV